METGAHPHGTSKSTPQFFAASHIIEHSVVMMFEILSTMNFPEQRHCNGQRSHMASVALHSSYMRLPPEPLFDDRTSDSVGLGFG